MKSFIQFLWRAFAMTIVGTTCVAAQTNPAGSVSPNYLSDFIKSDPGVRSLGGDVFGDSLNYQSGNLIFHQDDIVLVGTGPEIRIRRTYDVGETSLGKSPINNAADWTIELPTISTNLPMDHHSRVNKNDYVGLPHAKWNGREGTPTAARCSGYGIPLYDGSAYLQPEHWWKGVSVKIPGEQTQQILQRVAENPISPTMVVAGVEKQFHLVTNDNWQVACLPSLKNSEPGEGFLLVSPVGMKYWFDWLVFNGVFLDPDRLSGPNHIATEAQMLLTRVEDSHGNSVVYEYQGRNLSRIVSSDGREVVLEWIHHPASQLPCSEGCVRDAFAYIDRIVVQPNGPKPRIWDYQYELAVPPPLITPSNALWWREGRLRKVILPDGSNWAFALDDLWWSTSWYTGGGRASRCMRADAPDVTAKITAPSGVTGEFVFDCLAYYQPLSQYPNNPIKHDAMAIKSKRLSGPGLDELWTYSFSGRTSDSTPQPQVTATIVAPSGSTARYTVYNTFDDPLDGRVSKIETSNQGSTNLTRSETFVFAPPSGWAFPARIGAAPVTLGYSQFKRERLERYRPVQSHTITQDGVDFTHRIDAYDYFTNPTVINKSNNVGYNKTDLIAYNNNFSKWLVGRVDELKDQATGSVEIDNDFDNASGRLLATRRFGKLQQKLTYHSDGNIATIADGKDNTTTLTNYKRGIPQNIEYADHSVESADVDDAGWIRSVTDERQYVTRYDYDPMGRLKLIDYPDGDSVDWVNTVSSFEQINADEYGISAGHWRQTVTTGNARKTIYFDALWRPLVEREEDLSNPATIRVSAKRYDHEGRVSHAYYPQDGSYTSHAQFTKGVHTDYDALGRVTEMRQDAENGQVLTTTTQYLPGFETLVTNPRQKQTRTRYAALDQPTYNYPVKIFLPEGVTTTIARDPFFKPTQLTRSGTDGTSVDRFYFYDEHQRLCRVFEPEADTVVTDYDAAGNVAWTGSNWGFWGEGCHREDIADANRIKRTYDARNRLTHTDYPTGTDDITLAYEPTGEVKLAKMGGTEWRYTHNKRGLVTQEALAMDGETRALDYGYTPEGHRASVKYPRGRTVAYAPNALGQPTQAGSYVSDVRYWPEGDVRSMRYANGIAYSSQKNDRRLSNNRTYASANGALLYSQDLMYDANANLTGVNDLAGNGPSRSRAMTYDELDRLKTAVAPGLWGTESFTYDALDNIRTRVKDGQTYGYFYDGLNRLRDLKIGAAAVRSYSYDMYGNVICRNLDGCLSGGGLTFDLANRLQRYDGVQANQYDAWGRRVRKADLGNGAETQSLYSQSGQLMVEHDSAANTISDYVYLGTSMVAKVSDTLPLLAAPSTSGGGFTLTWPAGSATRYIVEESANFGEWTAVYDGTALTWSAGGRAPGIYRYRVKACMADGVCTTYTSAVTVKVMPDLTPIIYELLLN